MKVIFLLREGPDGHWSVCRNSITLFSQLRLGAAIKLAREAARDEHQRSGRAITVELPGPQSRIELASYSNAPVAV